MVTQKYTLSILNDSVGGQDGTPQTHPQTRKNTKWHPQNPCHDWGLPVEHLYHPPPLPPPHTQHNPTPRTSVLLPQRTSVPPVGITEPTDCLLNILSHRNYTTTNTFNTMIEWQTTHTHTHTHTLNDWMTSPPTTTTPPTMSTTPSSRMTQTVF